MSEFREGGCLCGAVRYKVPWPPMQVMTCHCRHCQKQAGSALSVVLVFPRAKVALTGELRSYEDRGTSGRPVHRRFCPNCGSPVVTDTPSAERDGIIFVKGGTLDDASGLKPAAHYWVSRAQDWFVFPPGDRLLERE